MEWISVKEKLPPELVKVDVWVKWKLFGVAEEAYTRRITDVLYHDGGWFYDYSNLNGVEEQVTHWMPLPSVPTDSGEKA